MTKFRSILLLVICTVMLLSCKKNNDKDQEIADYIKANNITAIKDETGLYYQIIKPGSGDYKYHTNTQITIKYEGKLLDGKVFDNGDGKEQSFYLSSLIKAWQIGVPKIQKGGEIRLICPPNLGYGSQASGPIPANSVLDFKIELINVQ
jgi:FKBP-type peptidyl-prolyl cis-trans isomerase FkpA